MPALATMVSATVSQLLSIPWIEETVMILIAALVYLYTHRGTKSTGLYLKMKKPEMEEEDTWASAQPEVKCQADASSEQDMAEADNRIQPRMPQTSIEVPGVTDSRFTGTIIAYKPEEGYGFIQCKELHQKFGRDVFLHRLQVRDFSVGSVVSFSVFLNKQRQPQAKDLEVPVHAQADEQVTRMLEQCTRPTANSWAPQSGRYSSRRYSSTCSRQWPKEPLSPPPSSCQEQPGQATVPKQTLNPYAKPYVLGGVAQPQTLNPFASQFTPSQKVLEFVAKQSAEEQLHSEPAKIEGLEGVWVGEAGETFKISIHSTPQEGQPFGHVVRRKASGASKVSPLYWESGRVMWTRAWSLDPADLAETSSTATWQDVHGNKCNWQKLDADPKCNTRQEGWTNCRDHWTKASRDREVDYSKQSWQDRRHWEGSGAKDSARPHWVEKVKRDWHEPPASGKMQWDPTATKSEPAFSEWVTPQWVPKKISAQADSLPE